MVEWKDATNYLATYQEVCVKIYITKKSQIQFYKDTWQCKLY